MKLCKKCHKISAEKDKKTTLKTINLWKLSELQLETVKILIKSLNIKKLINRFYQKEIYGTSND